MATSKFDVSGMSIDDIMSMDWDDVKRLSRSELAKVTSRLASAGNKRLRRMEKSGITYSPAYSSAMRGGGNFSVKGKGVNELRTEFARVRNFLNLKTSTVKGAKEFKKKFENMTSGLSNNQIGEFFDMLHRLQESDRAFFEDSIRYKIIMEILTNKVKEMSGTELYNYMRKRIDELYEQQADEFMDVSGMFDQFNDI